MSGKAPESMLAALHGELAKHFLKKLESGEVTAADLNCMRQFLKDNGIECDGERNPDMKQLVDDLPSFEDEQAHLN